MSLGGHWRFITYGPSVRMKTSLFSRDDSHLSSLRHWCHFLSPPVAHDLPWRLDHPDFWIYHDHAYHNLAHVDHPSEASNVLGERLEKGNDDGVIYHDDGHLDPGHVPSQIARKQMEEYAPTMSPVSMTPTQRS